MYYTVRYSYCIYIIPVLLKPFSDLYKLSYFSIFLLNRLIFISKESNGSTPVNLQKLLTPAADSQGIMQSKNSKSPKQNICILNFNR